MSWTTDARARSCKMWQSSVLQMGLLWFTEPETDEKRTRKRLFRKNKNKIGRMECRKDE